MEDFDYSKIIWGSFIAGYLAVQWLGRKKSTPTVNDESLEERWQEWQEDLDTEPKSRTISEPIERVEPRRVKMNKSDRVVSAVKPMPNREEGVEEERKACRKGFNLRDAVIMSEILNPKFKDK